MGRVALPDFDDYIEIPIELEIQMEKKKSDLIKVTGLWLDVEKGYMNGPINSETIEALKQSRPGDKFIIFKNNFKTEDKHPTHVLYIKPKADPNEGRAKLNAVEGNPDFPF